MCSDLPSDGGDKGLPELLEYRLAGMALAHRVVHHVLQTADVLSYTVSVLCGGGSRALQRRQPLSDLPLPFWLGCPLCDDLRTAMAMAPHNHRHLSLGNVLRGRGRGRRRTAEPSQTFHPSAWTASSQPCPTNHHSRYRDTPALRRELSKVSTTVGRQRTGSVSSLDHGGYRARYRPSPCGAALHRASCSGSSSSPSSPPSSSLQQRDQKLLHEPVRRQCPPNPPGHRAAAAWAAAACQWRGGSPLAYVEHPKKGGPAWRGTVAAAGHPSIDHRGHVLGVWVLPPTDRRPHVLGEVRADIAAQLQRHRPRMLSFILPPIMSG